MGGGVTRVKDSGPVCEGQGGLVLGGLDPGASTLPSLLASGCRSHRLSPAASVNLVTPHRGSGRPASCPRAQRLEGSAALRGGLP